MPRNRSVLVIIVGTSHSIQNGAHRAASEELKAFLENLCRTYEIRDVAEEMNIEALSERKLSASVPMQLANSLRLEHRFCDPERAERVALGIFQENDIRAQAFLSGWTKAEILSRLAESQTKRERYWLDELRALNQWPVLFVCGADHVASFCALLKQEAIAVHVAAKDWTPNSTVERDARNGGARSSSRVLRT